MDDRNEMSQKTTEKGFTVQIPLWTIGTGVGILIFGAKVLVQIPLWTIGTGNAGRPDIDGCMFRFLYGR